MNDSTKNLIIQAAQKKGFNVHRKRDGTEYVKNLAFRSDKYLSTVYIHTDTGMTASGDINYMKVAVHPDHFKMAAVNPSEGIENHINRNTKKNRFLSSNYTDFPVCKGDNEPCGCCYKVTSIPALEKLLSKLSSR